MLRIKNFWLTSIRFCSNEPQPLRSLKRKSVARQVKHFIDSKRILAQGGNGGNGCISFLQLWSNETAGPDGGDGGHGGHVILEATTNVRDLNFVNSVMKAKDGIKGKNKDCNGANADHLVVQVPVGTVVKNTMGQIVADLSVEGTLFILARGGAGGRGNHFFATDVRQTPMIAESGATGETKFYTLEVMSMAHFGLLGLPNAGKSTLLQAISRARPKVAPYPFTTLKPYLGIVNYDDFVQIAVADLPGLIEGSHKNFGLGIEFLKHAERCSCLLMILDASENPINDLQILRSELKAFSSNLSSKKQIIVANKMDIEQSKVNLPLLKNHVGNTEVIPISAKYGLNITKFLVNLRQLFNNF